MDIKFHITKIIQSGSAGEDWMNFIDQLKQNKCDRDLLAQIYTVALNNITVKTSKIYKKLLVGLANLQCETSPDLARKTFSDVNCLDPDCSVVCVYYAQFEYQYNNKNEASRILRCGKCEGRTPKFLIKKAYHNLRDSKANLFDGIVDPWDEALNDVTDTATITQKTAKRELQSPQHVGIKNSHIMGSLSKSHSKRNLGMPTRSGKTQSASSILKDVKIKSPTEELKEKLGLMVGENFAPRKINENLKIDDSGIFVAPALPKIENNENVSSEKCYGPSLSPFMVHASPLVNRKPLSFLENTPDVFMFNLMISNEKDKSVGKKNVTKKFQELFKDDNPTDEIATPLDNNSLLDIVANESMSQIKKIAHSSLSETVVKKQTIENVGEHESHSTNIVSRCDAFEKSQTSEPSSLTGLLSGLNMENVVQKATPSHASSRSNKRAEKKPEIDDLKDFLSNLSKIENYDESMASSLQPKQMPKRKPLAARDLSFVPKSISAEVCSLTAPALQGNAEENSQTCSSAEPASILENHKRKTSPSYSVKEKIILSESKESVSHLQTSTMANVDYPPQKKSLEISLNASQSIGNLNQMQLQPKPKETDVKKLLENGLAMLGQNGFNMNTNVQHMPVNQTKVFTVNGQPYKQIKCIGKGGSCKVYEVVSASGRILALKKVRLQDLDDFMIDSYLNEIKWLEKMKGNTHIIELLDWERCDSYLLLVMEKGDSDLAIGLRNIKVLSPATLKTYWQQMLYAVQEIHNVGIVHADLKPANFLFVHGILKLIDFGIANGIQGEKTSITREYQMGTLNYMPPEALMPDSSRMNGATRISRASDVWSLGCMLYLMVFKKTPYQHIKNQNSKMVAIQQGQPIYFDGVQDRLLLDCLQGCLKYNKRERYTIQELLAHEFLK